MKELTRQQVQSRKDRAARFLRDVLQEPERAEEVEDEDVEDYAARRRITIVNNPGFLAIILPKGGNMARPTREELESEIDDLTQENDRLQDQLDAINDILSAEEEEEEEEEPEESEPGE